MVAQIMPPALVTQKLKAFEQLQSEFEQCFLFIVDIHGQRRFSSLTVSDVVHYLHALWITDCRTSLLSVSKTIKEYGGLRCLDVLQHWQEDGDTAMVIDFLYRKLDGMPFVGITRQIHEARHLHLAEVQAQRLQRGRAVLLNRGMNLMTMLDGLFSLSEDVLATEVHKSCVLYGHLPEQINQQRIAMQSPLYTYVPHQILAERNMRVMNTLGRQIMAEAAEVMEAIIPGYQELS